MEALNELSKLAVRVGEGASAQAELIRLIDGIVAASDRYDKETVESCLSAIEAGGLMTHPGIRDKTSEGSAWLASHVGLWLAAKVLESSVGGEAAIQAWARVIDRDAGPSHEAHFSRARLWEREGRFAEALADLKTAIEWPKSAVFLSRAAALFSRIASRFSPPAVRTFRLALLSSSATELSAPHLRLLCFRDGMNADMYVGPFDSFRQDILDPGSALYAFSPDIVIIATHWRDAHLPAFSDDPDAQVERVIEEFGQLWRTLLGRLPCRIIQHGFDLPAADPYGHLGSASPGGVARLLRRINERMRENAPPSVTILDAEKISGICGIREWSDPRYWHSMKQHPAAEALPELADHQVALVRAALGLSKKVLAVDLDNTLWGGIIGEDGLGGIALGPPSARGEAFQAFQHYILELKNRGILLVVCSKNNPEDARLPFFQHDGSVLRFDDFSVFRANWLDKPTNLRGIAQALNLGLDSFVFIDDNPAERSLVRKELPEVTVPDLGDDPANFVTVLERGRYFEALSLSQEDRDRSESYKGNALREELRATSPSLDAFLAGLRMEAASGPFDELILPRVVQLIGKTNQFNLTCRRHSEERLRRMMGSQDYWTRYFRLRDRFGDHGLIGVMITRRLDGLPDTWEIDTWLMSCRVIGRGMERFMMKTLQEAALKSGIRGLRGIYVPSEKNSLVAGLYPELGFRKLTDPGREISYFRDLGETSSELAGHITDVPAGNWKA